MPETASLRCNRCGQGVQITQTDRFNNRAPRHCPYCGLPTLVRAKSAMAVTEAECFTKSGIDPQLITLLYQLWCLPQAKPDSPAATHDRFIDYMREQIAEGTK